MKKETKQIMKNVKGTYDYLPDEQLERNRVIDILMRNFENYGFNPIETPILSMEDVLASKYAGGAEIMKEVYTLTDQGERALGLRYDLTVPFAKFISLNKNFLNYPFKKYEIGKVYRNGPIKRGRKREFIQADVDVVGVSSIYAELEFFKMIESVAEELNLEVIVKYNDRRVLSSILKNYYIADSEMSSVILTIDKLEKLTKDDILKELEEKGIQRDKSIAILKLLSKEDNIEIQDIINQENLQSFKCLINLVKKNCGNKNVEFKFTPSLARGLEVYTGTIWEVFIKDKNSEITSSIAAGGRYNNIIGKLLEVEEEYPAVGMTFGVDVIMEVLRDKVNWSKKTVTEYLIVPMNGMETYVVNFAELLRKRNIKLEIDYSGKKIKKILNRANKLGIPFVSVFGEDEKEKGIFKIKEMKTGKEKEYTISEINEIVKLIDSSGRE
jgi:histidyl-tRNA synthetase